MFIHDAAQDFRFLETQLSLVGFRDGPARFQMRGDKRDSEIRRHRDVHLGKTAADGKAAAIEQEAVIRVRVARDDGEPAQNGNVNIRVPAPDVFPVRKIQSLIFERPAQFQERIGAAHLFQRDDVWIQRADAFADFGPGPGGFRVRTRLGRLIQIIFHIVSGNAKSFDGKGNRTKQRERQTDERK